MLARPRPHDARRSRPRSSPSARLRLLAAPGPPPCPRPARRTPYLRVRPRRPGAATAPEPADAPRAARAAPARRRARPARRGGARPPPPRSRPRRARARRRGRRGAPDPLARSLRAALARVLAPPTPRRRCTRARRPEDAAAAARAALPASGATHVGAGAVERGGVRHAFVLPSRRRAALEPFPRDVPAGARGRALRRARARARAPARVRDAPVGRRRARSTAAGERGFRAPIAFPVRGRYTVEVIADGARGPEVAALLTVSAGGAPLERRRARACRPSRPIPRRRRRRSCAR